MVASDYFRAIGRHWLVMLVCTLLGGAIGWFWAEHTPSLYQSRSAVILTSNTGTTAAELVQGSNFTQNQIASYVLLATSPLVLNDAAERLDDKISSVTLSHIVSASNPLNTTVIELSVVATSPDVAQSAARAVATSLRGAVADVAPAGDGGDPTVNVTVIQEATYQPTPVAPNTRSFVLVGLVIGFIVGLGYALFRGLYWRTIGRPSDIRDLTAAPVLGEVLEAKRGNTLVSEMQEDVVGPVAESVRGVAANLRFLNFDEPVRSVVLSSASPGEGKTSLAVALAAAVAESSRRVLLIDADLRRPAISEFTQLESSVGLTTVVLGERDLASAVQSWAGADVLTTGEPAPNPAQLLSSDAMARVIEQAIQDYDFVIIDTPPLLSVADATVLGHMTDGIVLVARQNKTHRRHFVKAIAALSSASVPLLGVTLSRVGRRNRNRYDSYRPMPRPAADPT